MADKELEEIRGICIEHIYTCADNVLQYLENDKEQEIDKLRSHIKHYCLHENYPDMIEQVLENNKNELDTSDVNEFEAKFNIDLNSMIEKMNVKSHPWMVQLDKIINRGNGIAGNLNMIDSLTKRPIQNPVSNKHCGHIYEKEAIINHINIKKKALCPVVGCENRKPLREEDLFEIDSRHLTQQCTSNEVHDVDMDSE